MTDQPQRGGAPPLVPRPVVIVITLALLAYMGLAVERADYKSALVTLIPLLFILGADVGTWIRSWRGTQDPARAPGKHVAPPEEP